MYVYKYGIEIQLFVNWKSNQWQSLNVYDTLSFDILGVLVVSLCMRKCLNKVILLGQHFDTASYRLPAVPACHIGY